MLLVNNVFFSVNILVLLQVYIYFRRARNSLYNYQDSTYLYYILLKGNTFVSNQQLLFSLSNSPHLALLVLGGAATPEQSIINEVELLPFSRWALKSQTEVSIYK